MTLEDDINKMSKWIEEPKNLDDMSKLIAGVIVFGFVMDSLMDWKPEPEEPKTVIKEFVYYKNPKEWLYVKRR